MEGNIIHLPRAREDCKNQKAALEFMLGIQNEMQLKLEIENENANPGLRNADSTRL
jgi:hypothetical protein